MKDKHSKILLFEDGRMCTVVGFGYPDCQTILQGCQIRPNTGCTSYTEVSVIQNFKDKKMFYQGVLSWWCSAVLDYACIMLIYTSFYVLHLYSLITKLKVSKSSYNSVLELSFVLVRLAVRYLNCSLPNPIPCVLDILEVLVEDTEQPRFLPWEFDTQGLYNIIY